MDDRERSRATRVRAGRWISTGGLIGLGVAFFLPQLPGCNEPIVPARELVSEDPSLLPFFFPFYFAFAMLVVYLLRALLKGRLARRVLAHVAGGVTLAACLIFVLVCLMLLGGISNYVLLASFGVSALAGIVFTIVLWAKAPPNARTAALVTLAGFLFIGYLLPLARGAKYGFWVTLLSSLIVAIGGLIEAFALWDAPENALAVSPPTR